MSGWVYMEEATVEERPCMCSVHSSFHLFIEFSSIKYTHIDRQESEQL